MPYTETALLWIANAFLMATDSCLLSLLFLFDLRAAFDVISHNILLKRVFFIGINPWLVLILNHWPYSVHSIQNYSNPCPPLSLQVCHRALAWEPSFSISYLILWQFHFFSDTLLYLSTSTNSLLPPSSLDTCMSKIKLWFTSNFPKLNRD